MSDTTETARLRDIIADLRKTITIMTREQDRAIADSDKWRELAESAPIREQAQRETFVRKAVEAALEEAETFIKREHLIDNNGSDAEVTYDAAVEDCLSAIRNIDQVSLVSKAMEGIQ